VSGPGEAVLYKRSHAIFVTTRTLVVAVRLGGAGRRRLSSSGGGTAEVSRVDQT
jgi:hypothetical protein